MTQPTQAQIDAAVDAYIRHDCDNMRDAIAAALTAAAEAGEESHLVSEIHRQHSEIDKLRAEKAATIERCAQVANTYPGRIGRQIAAEIRALKNEP